MSGRQRQELVITGLRGMDRSTTAQIAIPTNKALEMENVDLYRTSFARKRNGCEAVFGETTGEAFTDILASMGRHVPAADETASELWAVDADYVTQRLTGGTAWSTPTLKDAFNANAYDVNFVSFNGKLWLFGNTAVDRSHLWDTSTVRRVGVATPSAPTVANTGAGAYAATLRYYRVRYAELSGSTIIRKGEASASQSFTPSGGGTAARVTKPASVSEGETHWELEISTDDSTWYFVARTAVGTTTYDDSADPFSYTTLAPLAGEYTVPVSAKYGVVDGDRMLMAGSWESTTYTSRVWFTPRRGTLNGDDERVPTNNYVDVDEKDGDFITGLGGPFEGHPIVFKYRHIWSLRPTGSVDAPYQPLIISKVVGAIRQQLVVMAEDENNQPAIYFWSHRGPYRFGIRGLQFLGEDLRAYLERVNLDASALSGFAIHHTDKHQIWFYVALDSETSPTHIFVFDTRLGEPDEDNQVRDGWTMFTGTIATARCAVMYSSTIAASTSRKLKPYIGTGTAGSAAVLLRGDTGTLDNGSAYAATVTLPEKHLAWLRTKCMVDQAIVLGSAGPHTLTLTMSRDYGCEERQSSVTMAAETSDQTRAQRAIENAFQADAMSIGARIGDQCPVGFPWQLDALVFQFEGKNEIAG